MLDVISLEENFAHSAFLATGHMTAAEAEKRFAANKKVVDVLQFLASKFPSDEGRASIEFTSLSWIPQREIEQSRFADGQTVFVATNIPYSQYEERLIVLQVANNFASVGSVAKEVLEVGPRGKVLDTVRAESLSWCAHTEHVRIERAFVYLSQQASLAAAASALRPLPALPAPPAFVV